MNCPKQEVDNSYKTVFLGYSFLVCWSYGYFYIVFDNITLKSIEDGFLFIRSSGFGLIDELKSD